MSIGDEQRRFNWIHLYCDALRWALVNEVAAGDYYRIATFQDLVDALCEWWLAIDLYQLQIRFPVTEA